MAEITIDIAPDGSVKVEGHGFVGDSCKAETADIEKALGAVEKTTKKPEYHRTKAIGRTVRG